MLRRLARAGYGDLAGDAEAELVVDPPASAAEGLSAGTPFSLDHRFTQTAWFRPGNASNVPGLWFAGAGTVPGVGVPMVLISGGSRRSGCWPGGRGDRRAPAPRRARHPHGGLRALP